MCVCVFILRAAVSHTLACTTQQQPIAKIEDNTTSHVSPSPVLPVAKVIIMIIIIILILIVGQAVVVHYMEKDNCKGTIHVILYISPKKNVSVNDCPALKESSCSIYINVTHSSTTGSMQSQPQRKVSTQPTKYI